VSGRLRPTGLALLAWPTTISAWPARRGRGARSAITASTAIVVARPGRARRRSKRDEVFAWRTGVVREWHRARSQGMELIGRGLLTVRWLGGGEAAALQRRGAPTGVGGGSGWSNGSSHRGWGRNLRHGSVKM
jgi:hypothetical protein